MSDDYQRLLTATIDHLEILKGRGTNYVTVDSATLTSLSQPVRLASVVSRQEVKSTPVIEKVSTLTQPEITTPVPRISVGTPEKQAAIDMTQKQKRAISPAAAITGMVEAKVPAAPAEAVPHHQLKKQETQRSL